MSWRFDVGPFPVTWDGPNTYWSPGPSDRLLNHDEIGSPVHETPHAALFALHDDFVAAIKKGVNTP